MIVEINVMTFSKKKWMLVLLSEGQSLMIWKVYQPLFILYQTMHFIRSVIKLLATNQSSKIKVAHFNLTHTKSE